MILFPVTRPCLGLSVTPNSAYLVEIQRTWWGPSFRRLAQQFLPPDLIHLSPSKPNISSIKDLVENFQSLLKKIKRPQPIALCLPDLCARTTVFEFSSFPKKKTEREAILSWRFQQDLNLSTQKARIAHRLYQPATPRKNSLNAEKSSLRVLATAMQQDIIEQYEQACFDVGLLPVSVGLAGLDVFDMYRQSLQKALGAASNRSHIIGGESLFLFLAEWGFSFIALREGCPVFLRIKSLRLPRIDSRKADRAISDEDHSMPGQPKNENTTGAPIDPGSSQEESEHMTGGYASLASMTIAKELVATIQYYFESIGPQIGTSKSLPLFFAEGVDQGKSLLPTGQQVEDMLTASMSHPPAVAIIPVSDNKVDQSHGGKALLHQGNRTALPAFASVMVA